MINCLFVAIEPLRCLLKFYFGLIHCVITSVPIPVQLCGKSVVIHNNPFEFFVFLLIFIYIYLYKIIGVRTCLIQYYVIGWSPSPLPLRAVSGSMLTLYPSHKQPTKLIVSLPTFCGRAHLPTHIVMCKKTSETSVRQSLIWREVGWG
jgi:hypothetical protein